MMSERTAKDSRSSLDRSSARRRDPYGRYMVWLCAGALAFNLLMVVGVLGLLAYHGLQAFWPRELVLFELDDGSKLLGEVHDREQKPGPEEGEDSGEEESGDSDHPGYRLRVKAANKYLNDKIFVWIDEDRIRARSTPADATLLERVEWGNFHGFPVELRPEGADPIASGDGFWDEFRRLHDEKLALLAEIDALEHGPMDDLNHRLKRLELERRGVERDELPDAQRTERLASIDAQAAELQAGYAEQSEELRAKRAEAERDTLVMAAADGTEREVPVAAVVRAIWPNAMTTGEKWQLYFERLGEFVWENPRESNTEGGIFPAIFGTVLMVFLMTLFVVPLGVLAALYLREYARDGVLVRFVRIAVNNLAGVPSIVFGVFGLGFFVYLCGATIDHLLFSEALPTPTFGTGGIFWASLTLALLTLPVVIVATEEGLASVPNSLRAGSLALGATKFETIRRVVLPAAFPGVLTGTILAMARAAGEVAPLMIVGMVKLAPTLPIDGYAPFLHLERKFMHLGFHIFDLGFQSPDVEAGKPLVFATSLLLVVLVVIMNLVAISVRNHLRRKYISSSV